jgi:hypothetical protein
MTVYSKIKAQTTGTNAWEWIKDLESIQDGREAMAALRGHDGPAEMIRESLSQIILLTNCFTNQNSHFHSRALLLRS